MSVREFKTVADITDYYRYNITTYGLETPRTMGYQTGPIDDRLISHMLPSDLPRNFSLLDVGCGLGQIIPILEERFKHSHLIRMVGIDLVEEFIKSCSKSYPQFEFLTADFLEWQSSERFDVVIAAGVLVTRIAEYEVYLQRFISKMVAASNRWVGFNVIGSRDASYTAKHLVTISESSLETILGVFPTVKWTVNKIEVFPGSEDTFVCGVIAEKN